MCEKCSEREKPLELLFFFFRLVCHTVNTTKIKCGEEAQKETVGAYKIAPNFHQSTQSD